MFKDQRKRTQKNIDVVISNDQIEPGIVKKNPQENQTYESIKCMKEELGKAAQTATGGLLR